MKKYIFTLLCAGLAMMLSCKKNNNAPLPDVTQEGITLITADLESVFGTEELWQKGSYLGLFGSEKGTNEKFILKNAGVDKASAEFYGPEVKGNRIMAYFPYNPSFAGGADTMPVNLEPDQLYVEGADSLAQFLRYSDVSYGYMQQNKLKFVHTFGMMKVQVALDGVYTVYGITVGTGEQPVAGLGAFFPDGTMQMAPSSAKSVTLDCGDGVSSRDSEGKVRDFYFVLAPGLYSKLVITIYLKDEDPVVCELNNLEIKRISAEKFILAPVVVKAGGLGELQQQEVEFDE